MKKFLYLCLISLFISGLCVAENTYKDRNEDMMSSIIEKNSDWFKRLGGCKPARATFKTDYGDMKLAIYGKTKNGKCHYADSVYYRGEITPIQCVVPMPVALALSTTALDSIDDNFEQQAQNIKAERKAQFMDIYKMTQDYCDYTPLVKKYGRLNGISR